jgi:hypothetical protein
MHGPICIVWASLTPFPRQLAPVLDVIGNKRALAVSRAWAGHPGTLVRTLPPAPPPAPGPAPAAGTYAVGAKSPGRVCHCVPIFAERALSHIRSELLLSTSG